MGSGFARTTRIERSTDPEGQRGEYGIEKSDKETTANMTGCGKMG